MQGQQVHSSNNEIANAAEQRSTVKQVAHSNAQASQKEIVLREVRVTSVHPMSCCPCPSWGLHLHTALLHQQPYKKIGQCDRHDAHVDTCPVVSLSRGDCRPTKTCT